MAEASISTIRLDHSPALTPNNLSAIVSGNAIYFTYLHDNIACMTVCDTGLGDGATRNFTVASAGHGSPGTSVTQSKWLTYQGKLFLCVLSSVSVQFFSLSGQALLSHPLPAGVFARGVCVHGAQACVGLSTGVLLLFNINNESPLFNGEISGPGSPVTDVAASTKGLASAHEDGSVHVRDATLGNPWTVPPTETPVASLLIIDDTLLVGLTSGAIEVYSLTGHVKIAAIDAHARPLTALTALDDKFVSVSEDSRVCVWALAGGRVRLHSSTIVTDSMLSGAVAVSGALVLCAYDVPRLTVVRSL